MQDHRTRAKRRLSTGIEARHSRGCALSHAGSRCTCKPSPSYRAFVYDRCTDSLVRKTFSGKGALAAAKQWRADALSGMGKGKNIVPTRRTLRESAEEWLAAAKDQPPTVLNRSGRPFKPSVLRGYEHDLRAYVLEDLGGVRLSEVRRADLQALVDRIVGQGLSGSKVRNIVVAIRVVYRHALERDEAQVNPTTGLRLPSGSVPRERAASAIEAADLLAAVPLEDRALWATAFYAGLRRGELRALRWDDVSLGEGEIFGRISVSRSWDDVEGEIAPKSLKGTRVVPMVALLHAQLAELQARTKRSGHDFVFGPEPDRPFTPNYIRERAAKAWRAANIARAERDLAPLVPIRLHECRHTFVSLMFEAGIPLEQIGDYIGHSTTYMTDRYRHLIEGHEQEAARKFGASLALADSRSRIEQLDESD